MILFYDKKTLEILGVVHDKVHGKEHLGITISFDNGTKKDIGKLIVGYEETETPGQYRAHNPHLFKHIEDFEKRKKMFTGYVIKLDNEGNVVDFVPKSGTLK